MEKTWRTGPVNLCLQWLSTNVYDMRTHITPEPRLTWNVMPQGPGRHLAVASLNGEAGVFRANVNRVGGVWLVGITTHGRFLDRQTFRLLADAKAYAQAVYADVEGVNL